MNKNLVKVLIGIVVVGIASLCWVIAGAITNAGTEKVAEKRVAQKAASPSASAEVLDPSSSPSAESSVVPSSSFTPTYAPYPIEIDSVLPEKPVFSKIVAQRYMNELLSLEDYIGVPSAKNVSTDTCKRTATDYVVCPVDKTYTMIFTGDSQNLAGIAKSGSAFTEEEKSVFYSNSPSHDEVQGSGILAGSYILIANKIS